MEPNASPCQHVKGHDAPGTKPMFHWNWTQERGWEKEEAQAPDAEPCPIKCDYCGGPNVWGDFQMMHEPFSPFRMCHDCLKHEPQYGEVVIERDREVVELEGTHSLLKRSARECGAGANPQWHVEGKKLIVDPHRIAFYCGAGDW